MRTTNPDRPLTTLDGITENEPQRLGDWSQRSGAVRVTCRNDHRKLGPVRIGGWPVRVRSGMEPSSPDRLSGYFGFLFLSNFEGGQGSFPVIALKEKRKNDVCVTTWSGTLTAPTALTALRLRWAGRLGGTWTDGLTHASERWARSRVSSLAYDADGTWHSRPRTVCDKAARKT